MCHCCHCSDRGIRTFFSSFRDEAVAIKLPKMLSIFSPCLYVGVIFIFRDGSLQFIILMYLNYIILLNSLNRKLVLFILYYAFITIMICLCIEHWKNSTMALNMSVRSNFKLLIRYLDTSYSCAYIFYTNN